MIDKSVEKNAEKKNRLIEIIRQKSYREGDFTLASGQKSPFYIDLKATTLDPEGAQLIGELFMGVRHLFGTLDAVGGLTLGADPISTAISLIAYQKGVYLPAMIVRKEPKSHGTQKYLEGAQHLKSSARVLVLEDVTTTGGSAIKAVERIREGGFEPAGVLTVVDRQQGAHEIFKKAGLPFHSLCTLAEIQKR